MRILIALTYYRPHYSGLTIYTERLARALVEHGHEVSVLTSRYLPELPPEEMRDGVRVLRPAVMMRVSKGVIMPTLPFWALRELPKVDVVNLHVPQLDASYISVLSRMMGKPVVLTYHCDLRLPKGMVHGVANQVSHLANHVSARCAHQIVTNTQDYAEESPFLKSYLKKTKAIPPPVEVAGCNEEDVLSFRAKFGTDQKHPLIGVVARLATEKGVEYLIEAMPAILEKYPNARVLFVGPYQNIVGEEQYAARLAPLIQKLGDRWNFLGLLSPVELASFYRECDVTVLPSINGTESFGIVQVESMISGTPVVTTDLPGVRFPIRNTGMGRIVPICNSTALAGAILEVLDHPQAYQGDLSAIRQRFSADSIAAAYEEIFKELCPKA